MEDGLNCTKFWRDVIAAMLVSSSCLSTSNGVICVSRDGSYIVGSLFIFFASLSFSDQSAKSNVITGLPNPVAISVSFRGFFCYFPCR